MGYSEQSSAAAADGCRALSADPGALVGRQTRIWSGTLLRSTRVPLPSSCSASTDAGLRQAERLRSRVGFRAHAWKKCRRSY